MTEKSSIFFISDCDRTASQVKSKIMLLRSSDNFEHVEYDWAFDKVKKQTPGAIFYDIRDHGDEFFSFINKVKQTPGLCLASIIVLFDKIDEALLCEAFEAGISDFICLKSTDSEFTIRALWAMQRKNKALDYTNKMEILSQLNIVDSKTGIYSKNYTFTIIKEESKKSIGSLAVIAPDINTRSKLSLDQLAKTIKKNIRLSDTIGFSGDFKIYVWFPETSENKIVSILKKIKKQLPTECSISAGIAYSANLKFEAVDEKANNALSRALLKDKSFAFSSEPQDKPFKEIKKSSTYSNFKMQKQDFLKRIEEIVSPIFFQTQKIIEEKLFQTDIKQDINDNGCMFRLKNENCVSTLKISYPGFTKVKISVSHKLGSEVLESNASFELAEVDREKIIRVLDTMVRDYQKYTSS